MSISTVETKVSYLGNGTTDQEYPIPYKYLEVGHVKVYADGNDITTACNFLGDGTTNGGSFTTQSAFTSDATIEVCLEVPFDQPVSLQETGTLPAKTIEVSGFDRLNMQIRRVWQRAVEAVSKGDNVSDLANDAGYVSTGDNVSELTNDANYVSNGDNVSLLANDAGYLTNIPDDSINSTKIQNNSIFLDDLGAGIKASLASGDSALQSGDNVSELVNDAGYVTVEGGTVRGTGANNRNIRAANEGTVAGNARGEGSVDLQTNRSEDTMVAAGTNSAILGGQNNTASADKASVCGGVNNLAGGANTFIGGGSTNEVNTNTGGAIIGGIRNTVSGVNSVVLCGADNTASGAESLAAGDNAISSHNGARVFADSTNNAFPSVIEQEFAIQGSALRLVDGNQGAGKILTCDANGSGNWADAPAGGSGGTVQGSDAVYDIQATNEGAVAGNARGENSVDLQTLRTNADEVASGTTSSIIGGIDNRASGGNSTVLGGQDNIASAYATIAAGRGALAGDFGARVFADGTSTGIFSLQPHEFAVQASALRLVDGNQGSGKVLTCDADGSGNWIDLPAGNNIGGTVQGTGATTKNIRSADEGTVAGDARGEGSVDLQLDRQVSDQVASGPYSAIIGGRRNKATANNSTIAGGIDNSTTANDSFISGNTNSNASARGAVVGGISNAITGTGSNHVIVGGISNAITATTSHAGVFAGNNNTVTAGNSASLGGQRNTIGGANSVALGATDGITSATDTLIAGGDATASHEGARVFGDNTATPIASIAANEFAIQGSALRLVDGNQGAGKVLTSDANGSGNWAFQDGVGESVTGTATFTNSTNNISLAGIGDLGGTTEVGDVIQVSGSTGNNKLYTVEVRTDANNVIVNQAHVGVTPVAAEEGNKALATENTGTQTITLYSKAKTAPLGIGQGWVDASASRALTTTYTNSTGRSIWVNIRSEGNGVQGLYVDNLLVSKGMETYDQTNAIIIQPDSEYYYTGGTSLNLWTELR